MYFWNNPRLQLNARARPADAKMQREAAHFVSELSQAERQVATDAMRSMRRLMDVMERRLYDRTLGGRLNTTQFVSVLEAALGGR